MWASAPTQMWKTNAKKQVANQVCGFGGYGGLDGQSRPSLQRETMSGASAAARVVLKKTRLPGGEPRCGYSAFGG